MAHNPRQFSRNFAFFAYCFLTPQGFFTQHMKERLLMTNYF